MRKILTGVALVGLMATSAYAQSPTPLQTYTLAAIADNASTVQFLADKTGSEGNPVINWIDDPTAMMVTGVALDVAAVSSWMHFTRDHKKLHAIGLYGAAIVRLGLAANNVSMSKHRFGGPTVRIPEVAPRRDRRRIALSFSVAF
jgi:hypothetical protein